MRKTYRYNGRDYKDTELASLAAEVLGGEIFDELIIQIRQGVIGFCHNYLDMSDIEKKVVDLRDDKFMSYKTIGDQLGITCNEAASAYSSATSKMERASHKGHISALNTSGKTYNCMKFIMDGENATVEEFYNKIKANYNILIKCQGIGHSSYNDIINEVANAGFDVSDAPRFTSLVEFSKYKNSLWKSHSCKSSLF